MGGFRAILLGFRTNLSRSRDWWGAICHCIGIKKESTEWGIGPHNGLGLRKSTGNFTEFKLIRLIEGDLVTHNVKIMIID